MPCLLCRAKKIALGMFRNDSPIPLSMYVLPFSQLPWKPLPSFHFYLWISKWKTNFTIQHGSTVKTLSQIITSGDCGNWLCPLHHGMSVCHVPLGVSFWLSTGQGVAHSISLYFLDKSAFWTMAHSSSLLEIRNLDRFKSARISIGSYIYKREKQPGGGSAHL